MTELEDTLLGLFTEIAIIEHLARTRIERTSDDPAEAGQFGILNYFHRTHPDPDTIGGIAWSFQEEESHTADKVASLEAKGYVTVTPAGSRDASAIVFVTESGRQAQEEKVQSMAPDFEHLVAEIPSEDLEITVRTLREIRLTLDHLPDR
jgi:DNA-binding MarR family transcriptional regulator